MSNEFLTLDHFSRVGLVADEIYPGIFVVDDFLTQGEISAIEAQIEGMSQGDWEKTYTESLYSFINDQYGVQTIEEARALGHDIQVDKDWADKNAPIDESISYPINLRLDKLFSLFPSLFLNGVGAMQRQYEGVSLSYHVDSQSNPLVVFANVIYVNDDFIGGELHFPNIDITYKPKKGSLIVFPSADKYLHGVLPVGPGPTRYALPAFVNRIR
jgi:hypothetical protein